LKKKKKKPKKPAHTKSSLAIYIKLIFNTSNLTTRLRKVAESYILP